MFGVSGCDFLRSAVANQNDWELKGEELTAKMIAECKKEFTNGVRFRGAPSVNGTPDGTRTTDTSSLVSDQSSIVSDMEASGLFDEKDQPPLFDKDGQPPPPSLLEEKPTKPRFSFFCNQ